MASPPAYVRVDGFEVAVSERPRRRTLRLTVERDASLTASVPPGTEARTVEDFVREKRRWLYRKLAERAEYAPANPDKEMVSGEGFRYLGRNYRLLIVDDEGVEPVRLVRGRLRLRADCRDEGVAHLTRWYAERGQRWIARRIQPWARRMGADMSRLRVRPLGYRWGSCGRGGTVNIHWATMQLGPNLVDYVLVHELAHLDHRDHGPEFWRAVERAMPDYATRRETLKREGARLWLP